MKPHYIHDVISESALGCSADALALSGGLDSSILAHILRERRPDAISVISADFVATDLTYCQLAASHAGLNLHMEKAQTAHILDCIEKTIQILGNFNDIEIRNSVVMYVAAEAARRRGARGLITGDGADELFAGYDLFLSKEPDELARARDRIIRTMHFPSHKIGQSLGLKIESPFLSGKVRDLALSLEPGDLVGERNGVRYGKIALRRAFEDVLPPQIAWRPKSAMQDGSGTAGLTSLFDAVIPDEQFAEKKRQAELDGVILRTKESAHYYGIFKKHSKVVPGTDHICPYCKSHIDTEFCRMCGAWPV